MVKCVVYFVLFCSVWPLAFPAPPGAVLGSEVPVWDWALPSLGWGVWEPLPSALCREKGRGQAGDTFRPCLGGTERLREDNGPRGTLPGPRGAQRGSTAGTGVGDTAGMLQGQEVGTEGTLQPVLPPFSRPILGSGCGGWEWENSIPDWGVFVDPGLGGGCGELCHLPRLLSIPAPSLTSLFLLFPSLIPSPPLTPPFSRPIPAPTSSFPRFLRLPRAMHIPAFFWAPK